MYFDCLNMVTFPKRIPENIMVAENNTNGNSVNYHTCHSFKPQIKKPKQTNSDILSSIVEERRSIIFGLILNFHAISVLISIFESLSYIVELRSEKEKWRIVSFSDLIDYKYNPFSLIFQCCVSKNRSPARNPRFRVCEFPDHLNSRESLNISICAFLDFRQPAHQLRDFCG